MFDFNPNTNYHSFHTRSYPKINKSNESSQKIKCGHDIMEICMHCEIEIFQFRKYMFFLAFPFKIHSIRAEQHLKKAQV